MPHLREHGGGCCGIRHIFGMDNTSVGELDRLIQEVRQMGEPVGQGRLIEIVLSERQVTGDRNPEGTRWTTALQERGFRLVSRFTNANSGRKCYVFHYHPSFLSLRPTDLPFTWVHGETPADVTDNGQGRPAATRQNEGEIVVGSRVVRTGGRVTNRCPSGTLGTVRRAYGNRLHVVWDNGFNPEGLLSILMTSVDLINTPQAPVQPVVPPVRVVATVSTYHNVLQRGRSEAGFTSYGLARASAPRARQVDRKDIVVNNEGVITTRWFTNVTR